MVIKAFAHETVYLNLEIPLTARVVKVRLPRSCYGAKIRPKCVPKSVIELDLFDSRITDVPAGVIGKNIAKLRLYRLTPRITVPLSVSDIFIENWPRDSKRLALFERIFVHVSENESIRGIGEHWIYSEDYADVVDLGNETYTAEEPIEITVFGLQFHATKRSPILDSESTLTAVPDIPDTQLAVITSDLLNQWTVTSEIIGQSILARDIEEVMASVTDALLKAKDFGILHREPIFRIVVRDYSDVKSIIVALKQKLPTDLLEITDTVVKENGVNMRAIEINGKWIAKTNTDVSPQASPEATKAVSLNLLPRAISADCSSMYV